MEPKKIYWIIQTRKWRIKVTPKQLESGDAVSDTIETMNPESEDIEVVEDDNSKSLTLSMNHIKGDK